MSFHKKQKLHVKKDKYGLTNQKYDFLENFLIVILVFMVAFLLIQTVLLEDSSPKKIVPELILTSPPPKPYTQEQTQPYIHPNIYIKNVSFTIQNIQPDYAPIPYIINTNTYNKSYNTSYNTSYINKISNMCDILYDNSNYNNTYCTSYTCTYKKNTIVYMTKKTQITQTIKYINGKRDFYHERQNIKYFTRYVVKNNFDDFINEFVDEFIVYN